MVIIYLIVKIITLNVFNKVIISSSTNSIPMLKLCAAFLLVQLFNESKSLFMFPFYQINFWSDFKIVLYWLRKDLDSLKVFQKNRVAVIRVLKISSEDMLLVVTMPPMSYLKRVRMSSRETQTGLKVCLSCDGMSVIG